MTKTKTPRLDPPPDAGLTPAPAPPSVLDRLEAHTRAPGEAAERIAEALRESLAPYLARARACHTRVAALRDQHKTELARLTGLDFTRFHLQLGGGPALAQQLQRAVREVRTMFEGHADEAGTVPSVLTILEGMPRRVAHLTAKDAHACPARCGCPVGTLKADIEDAEVHAARVPAQMATIGDLSERLQQALAVRGDGVAVVPGVPVVPRPAGPGRVVLTDFDPLR